MELEENIVALWELKVLVIWKFSSGAVREACKYCEARLIEGYEEYIYIFKGSNFWGQYDNMMFFISKLCPQNHTINLPN